MAKTRFRPLASTLRRAAACCALGAAITLGIAWWSAWRCDWTDAEGFTSVVSGVRFDPNRRVAISEMRSVAATRREVTKAHEELDLLPPAWQDGFVRPYAGFRWPAWGTSAKLITLTIPDRPRFEDARGWPFRAVWCEIEKNEQGQYSVRGGFGLPPSAPPDPLTYRALPYRPIWPGLAADTAVFALPLFVAWSFARVARSNRRVTRGRCPRCAYDLRFDLRGGCSECGWNRADHQLQARARAGR